MQIKKESSSSVSRPTAGVSTVIFASTTVVLIVIAAVGYGLYLMSTTSSAHITASSASSNYDTVTGLAYAHWGAIGNGNLSATTSQYSSSADLWWYVKGSALNTTSGPYTGNAISTTWQKFFNNVGGHTYWTVYNYSLSFSGSTAAKVTADVWYVIGSGSSTHTLALPYELDYNLQGGSWMLTADWWGLPSHPGEILTGVVAPSTVAQTTSTTTTQSATSSTTTSTAGGYGY